jgi:hypothetical protein
LDVAPIEHDVNLQLRAYGPASTREESEAIEDRVSRIGEHVLLLREIPVQSPFSINLMFDRLESLADGWTRFSYVVDLTDAGRPDAATRATLKERVLRVNPRVTHVAIVVGNNLLMRAMARLIAYGMGMTSVGVHVTRAEAIEEAVRAMGR